MGAMQYVVVDPTGREPKTRRKSRFEPSLGATACILQGLCSPLPSLNSDWYMSLSHLQTPYKGSLILKKTERLVVGTQRANISLNMLHGLKQYWFLLSIYKPFSSGDRV